MELYENCVFEKKRSRLYLDSNSATSFQSPHFVTADWYCIYMKLFTYGCDEATGKYVSLFVALSVVRYDGILKWPICKKIHISIVDQSDSENKWTQTITPSKENFRWFQRPSSSVAGNTSVGILRFINHSMIFGRGVLNRYLQNEAMFINVDFSGL